MKDGNLKKRSLDEFDSGYGLSISKIKDIDCIRNGILEYYLSSKKISHRDKGESSKSLDVKGCLKEQNILRNVNEKLIDKILREGESKTFKMGELITSEGEDGGNVFFILKGCLDVFINNRKIATRKSKECVGEMSALDPTQRRCATLIAAEEVEIFELKSEVFNAIAQTNMEMLKNIAVALCDRLRERSKYCEAPNDNPRVFIGSSTEGLKIAKKVKKNLNLRFTQQGKPIDIFVWNEDVFKLSESGLESLINESKRADFAILIFTPDDKIKTRDEKAKVARDNIIFELGLFMGSLGRERTYALVDDRVRLPSDLNGITIVFYKNRWWQKSKWKDFLQKIFDKILDQGVR